ncbi:hypothetical protein PR048_003225 [Dryococelus australis]|uniref:Uncharacterized protein n=1 Tax=Dryococelus australis TaxID=614101 RepID=A0ABQ9IMI1_9NEOP|nr:hypothetical protein PR048_003225 [Dryococelus australis]
MPECKGGEKREIPPETRGIVRHDSHVRKSGGRLRRVQWRDPGAREPLVAQINTGTAPATNGRYSRKGAYRGGEDRSQAFHAPTSGLTSAAPFIAETRVFGGSLAPPTGEKKTHHGQRRPCPANQRMLGYAPHQRNRDETAPLCTNLLCDTNITKHGSDNKRATVEQVGERAVSSVTLAVKVVWKEGGRRVSGVGWIVTYPRRTAQTRGPGFEPPLLRLITTPRRV